MKNNIQDCCLLQLNLTLNEHMTTNASLTICLYGENCLNVYNYYDLLLLLLLLL